MIALAMATGAAEASSLPTWMRDAFDVQSAWELWWIGFGLAAQAVFFGRWVIQWIASEREGASVVPVQFWWASLLGASMLLAYFIVRREPVGVIGQLTGWTIYTRNLMLISRSKRSAVETPTPTPTNET